MAESFDSLLDLTNSLSSNSTQVSLDDDKCPFEALPKKKKQQKIRIENTRNI